MEHKNKNLLIGGLLAIVFIMAVGYAAFATQLNINGTAEITSKWDVHIKSIAVQGEPTGSATDEEGVTKVDPDNNLQANFSAKLVAPGDSIVYTVTVENSGNLNAKVSGITVTQKNTGGSASDTVNVTGTAAVGNFTTEGNNPIKYTVTGIKTGDKLGTGESNTTTFTVTATYNDAVTSQPTEAQLKSDLTIVLSYEQDKA